MKPAWILLYLWSIAFINYFDRGALPALLKNIQITLNIGYTKAGTLASSFLIGYCLSTPIFAYLANKISPLKVICYGLMGFCIGAFLMGIVDTDSFAILSLFRILIGLGEAGFLCIAPSFIDDNAPVKWRSTWLAIFMISLPVGYAAGYLIGGIFTENFDFCPKTGTECWRAVFIAESIAIVPFIIFGFKISSKIKLKKNRNEEVDINSERKYKSFLSKVKYLFTNPVYVLSVIGYTNYNYLLGGFSIWGPQFISDNYNLSFAKADIYFGITSAISGILGTLIGGLLLDRMKGDLNRSSSISKALYLSSLSMLSAMPFILFSIYLYNLGILLFMLVVGLTLAFLLQGPINCIFLWVVPSIIRPLSVSFAIIISHLLGDVLSPIIMGSLLTYTKDGTCDTICQSSVNYPFPGKCDNVGTCIAPYPNGNFRLVLLITSIWGGISAIFWIIAYLLYKKKLKRKFRESLLPNDSINIL